MLNNFYFKFKFIVFVSANQTVTFMFSFKHNSHLELTTYSHMLKFIYFTAYVLFKSFLRLLTSKLGHVFRAIFKIAEMLI